MVILIIFLLSYVSILRLYISALKFLLSLKLVIDLFFHLVNCLIDFKNSYPKSLTKIYIHSQYFQITVFPFCFLWGCFSGFNPVY